MARRIIVEGKGSKETYVEATAHNEAQLQEFLKENPELLPLEEFDLLGPMMVAGREARVSSGSIDLVGLARGGEILIVEFKTGPQNPDFRQTLAQLIDYGAFIWKMSPDDFDTQVAVPYFNSSNCTDNRVRGKQSLQEAAASFWDGFTQEEADRFSETVAQSLASGSLIYVVAAQRFTDSMERALAYLNSAFRSAQLYGVEVVRFSGVSQDAFEARTVAKPDPITKNGSRSYIDELAFMGKLSDPEYQSAIRYLIDTAKELDLRFDWGTKGVSIRVILPNQSVPVTIAWLFPPGDAGWMSFTHLTLGYDPRSAAIGQSTKAALEQYLALARAIPGGRQETRGGVVGYRLEPSLVTAHRERIADLFKQLVGELQSESD